MKQKSTGRNRITWLTRNNNRISQLEEQLGALQLQQEQLSKSQQQLQLQASLVQGLGDTLLAMKKLVMLHSNSEQLKVLQAISELQEASQLEIATADSQPGASTAAPISASQSDQSATGGSSTAAHPHWPPPVLDSSCSIRPITPLSDPTAYVRQVLGRGPVPGAESMQIQHVGLQYREVVLQSSVLLHQMPLQSRQQQQAAVAELQELWDRFFHTHMSVFLFGQQCTMEQLFIQNYCTLQEDAEGSEAALTRVPSFLPMLGMTQQQQEVVSAAYATFLRHLKPITEERRQLQLQMAASSSTCSMPVDGNSSSSSSSSSNGSSSTGSINSTAALPPLSERRLQLDKHHQAVLQIERLLQKDAYLRMASAFTTLSCLSWEQVARFAVMSWPYAFRPMYLGKAVHELYAGHLQQSAQQMSDSGTSVAAAAGT